MPRSSTRPNNSNTANYWPGFVDAMATILLVIIFSYNINTKVKQNVQKIVFTQLHKIKDTTEDRGLVCTLFLVKVTHHNDLDILCTNGSFY